MFAIEIIVAMEGIIVITVWCNCFACQGGFLLSPSVCISTCNGFQHKIQLFGMGTPFTPSVAYLADPARPALVRRAVRAFLCLSVSPASPWLPSLPVSSPRLHFCLGASARALVVHPRWPEPRDRWASGPLTVITDPFPSHHLAHDLPSLGSK